MNSNAAAEVADHNSQVDQTHISSTRSTDSAAMSSPHNSSQQNYTTEDSGKYSPNNSHVTNSESSGGGGTVTSSAGGYGNGSNATEAAAGEFKSLPQGQPKRLHVSNIPFRFREPDLRQLFYVSLVCEGFGVD